MEVRKIQGWRGRLEDQVQDAWSRFWATPFRIVYANPEDISSASGRTPKHRRLFGAERAATAKELHELRMLKQRIRRSERTPDQMEADRAWWRQWRASKPSEWRRKQTEMKRRWRAAHREQDRETNRAWQLANRERINKRRRDLTAARAALRMSEAQK